MALRLMLVGLVVGLGVDLPSGDEVSSWVRAGRDWVQARIDDIGGGEVVADAKSEDAAFASIVDRMADTFAADLAITERAATARRLAFEPIEVREEAEAGVAYALNRESQGEGRLPEPALPEVAQAAAAPSEPTASGRAARLASAVRLTRQAASAWLGVIRGGEAASVVR